MPVIVCAVVASLGVLFWTLWHKKKLGTGSKVTPEAGSKEFGPLTFEPSSPTSGAYGFFLNLPSAFGGGGTTAAGAEVYTVGHTGPG